MRYSEWKSVPEYIIVQLKDMIVSGDYKHGDRFLTEKEICERFNVGRTSVREAFRVLEALGFIDLKRGRGAFVTKTSEEDKAELKNWILKHEIELEDIIDVRICIETVAVKNAIQRMSSAQLESLKEIVENMKLAAEEDKYHVYLSLDEKFHNTMVEASQNKLLVMINEQVQRVASEFRGRTFSFKGNIKKGVMLHERILMFIVNKDVESALKEIKRHIEIMKENLVNITS